jgi:hypothetical protein
MLTAWVPGGPDFFMENPAFIGVILSNVRMIMTIMCVLVKELLCQAVMRHVSVLKCLLSGAREHLWLRHVMSGIKWHCFPRIRLE